MEALVSDHILKELQQLLEVKTISIGYFLAIVLNKAQDFETMCTSLIK